MSLPRLCARVARLEAWGVPVVELPSMLPTLSDTFVAEVLRMLWAYGHFGSVEAMIHDTLGLTDAAVTVEVSRLLTENEPHARTYSDAR